MSPENLSRRAILAGAASVPVLALPAVGNAAPSCAASTASPVPLDRSSTELLALAEGLKPLFAAEFELKPKLDRAYDEAKRRGYSRLYDQWNAIDKKQRKLARAILKIEPTCRIGDGIHAAAAFVLDEELPYEGGDLLWEMAVRAGFPVRPHKAIKLTRLAAARSRFAKRQARDEAVQS
jgi:hypothetical protein